MIEMNEMNWMNDMNEMNEINEINEMNENLKIELTYFVSYIKVFVKCRQLQYMKITFIVLSVFSMH